MLELKNFRRAVVKKENKFISFISSIRIANTVASLNCSFYKGHLLPNPSTIIHHTHPRTRDQFLSHHLIGLRSL